MLGWFPITTTPGERLCFHRWLGQGSFRSQQRTPFFPGRPWFWTQRTAHATTGACHLTETAYRNWRRFQKKQQHLSYSILVDPLLGSNHFECISYFSLRLGDGHHTGRKGALAVRLAPQWRTDAKSSKTHGQLGSFLSCCWWKHSCTGDVLNMIKSCK